MNLNPLTLLDSILAEYLSPRARRAVHSLLLLVGLVVTVWLAVEKDWTEAIIALVGALYAGANRANTPAEPTVSEVADALDAAGVEAEVRLSTAGGEVYSDVADYDYDPEVYADASEPDTTGLPIDAPHGGDDGQR